MAEDLNGRPLDPVAAAAGHPTVFLFVRPDCPISNRYAPEVRRLHEEFQSRGVVFWLVYPDAELSSATIRSHLKDFDYPIRALKDAQHRLVNFCGVHTTPEAAIVSADGTLVYHGRIDDRYVAFGRWGQAASHHELEDAIRAVLEGVTVPEGRPAVGCSIPPLP